MNQFGNSKVYSYPLRETDKKMNIKLATNNFIRDSAAIILEYSNTTDSVTDPAMGIISSTSQCSTCNAVSYAPCNGHYGAIHLPLAIPNPNINSFVGVFINSYCSRCDKFIYGDQIVSNILKIKKESRYKELIKVYRRLFHPQNPDKIQCQNCNREKDGYTAIIYDMSYKSTRKTKQVVIGFRKITNDSTDPFYDAVNPNKLQEFVNKRFTEKDMELFGVDYPIDSLFLSYIPMIPNNMRYQSNEQLGGQNPLTTAYNQLKTKCKEIYGNNPNINNLETLQYKKNYNSISPESKQENNIFEFLKILSIYGIIIMTKATYNQTVKEQLYQLIGSRSIPNTPVSTIANALGKQGTFRRVINGCRVDMSGRSVLTGGPYISLTKLIIPSLFAKKITIPILVTDLNIDYMRALVAHGPEEYPGANRLIDNSKTSYEITEQNKLQLAQSLSIGSVVFRQLIDDDIVMCNRYPTMREESFGCHRVMIDQSKNVFAISMGLCKKMTADFDGDEIQLFGLPTMEDAFEALALLSPSNQLISYKDGAAIIGGAKDMGSGISLLKTKSFNKRQVVQIFKNKRTDDEANLFYQVLKNKFGNKEKYSGYELLSVFLPKPINYISGNGKIKIENGLFTSVDKSLVDTGSLFTVFMAHEFDSFTSIAFIDQTMNLLYAINELCGSTLLTNWVLPKEVRNSINTELNKMVDECDTEYNKLYQNYISELDSQKTEIDVQNIISDYELKIQEMIKEAFKNTEFYKFGTYDSIAAETLKACGFIGQQSDSVYGKLKPIIASGTRILSTFPKYNKLSRAQGLMTDNYISGTSPIGVFFAALVGRRQLYTKTHSIGDSGYFERQMAKNLINEKANYNGIVYGDSDNIISFSYGFDGINGKYQHVEYCYPLNLTESDIRELYKEQPEDYIQILLNVKKDYNKRFIEIYKKSPFAENLLIYNKSKPIEELDYLEQSNQIIKFILPFDLKNIIANVKEITKNPKYMSAEEQSKKIIELCKKFIICRCTKQLTDQIIELFIEQTYHLRIYCMFMLTSTNIKMSSNRWNRLEEIIIKKYMEAIIPPGDAVGLKAGYTITEPISQANLHAIHNKITFTFSESKLVKPGTMQRIKQLLLGASDLPIVKIVLKDRYNKIGYKEFVYKHNKIEFSELKPEIAVYVSSSLQKILDLYESKLEINMKDILTSTFLTININKELCAYNYVDIDTVKHSLEKSLGEIINNIFIDSFEDKYILYICINQNYTGQFGGLETVINKINIGSSSLFFNPSIEACTEFYEKDGQLKLREYYQILANIDYLPDANLVQNPFFKILTQNEVDQEFTTTNSPSYINLVYGIGEAERKMYEELSYTLTRGDFNKYTSSIEPRNIKTIAETCMVNGKIESFNRHGMLGSQSKDMFTTITFENSEKAISNVIAYNRQIPLNNSVSSVIYNTRSSLGTDICKTYLNID